MTRRPDFVNHRMPGESFKAYRARRRTIAKAIKLHCKGRLAVKSCDVVNYPEIGRDLKLDAAITKDLERGLLVDLVPVTLRDGSIRRVGRTKGVSFRYPVPRAEARKVALAASRAARV